MLTTQNFQVITTSQINYSYPIPLDTSDHALPVENSPLKPDFCQCRFLASYSEFFLFTEVDDDRWKWHSPVRSKSPIVIQTMDTIETTSVAERAFLVPIGHGQRDQKPNYSLQTASGVLIQADLACFVSSPGRTSPIWRFSACFKPLPISCRLSLLRQLAQCPLNFPYEWLYSTRLFLRSGSGQ